MRTLKNDQQSSIENHQSEIRIWYDAIRPKTLWAAVSPVLMGTAMAYSDGKFHLLAAFMAFVGALLIQIGTNFANDYFDFVKGADTKDRLGPTRATQAGLVKPETMKKAFILVFALAFVSGIYLIMRGGLPIFIVGISSILFGILYTAGPYPLGYNGLGDLFVLIFFGPVAVGGTYFVQALEINQTVLLAGLAPGLISSALLSVNNLRDIYTDKAAGKRTLAVRFGVTFTRLEYLSCILLAFFIPIILSWLEDDHYFVLITSLAIIFAIPSIKIVFRESGNPVLNEVLANTGKLLFLYSLFFSIGWLI